MRLKAGVAFSGNFVTETKKFSFLTNVFEPHGIIFILELVFLEDSSSDIGKDFCLVMSLQKS